MTRPPHHPGLGLRGQGFGFRGLGLNPDPLNPKPLKLYTVKPKAPECSADGLRFAMEARLAI